MSDWRDTHETQEQETSLPPHREVLGAEGMSSFTGGVKPKETEPAPGPEDPTKDDSPATSKNPDDSGRLVTIQPKKSPEYLPNVEAEGRVVDLDEGRREGKEGKI
jgi:hypothetical protein